MTKEDQTFQNSITDPKQLEETLRETLVLLSKKDRYNTIITSVIRTIHKSLSLQDVLENAVKALKQNIDNIYSTGIYLVEGKEADSTCFDPSIKLRAQDRSFGYAQDAPAPLFSGNLCRRSA